MNEVANLFAAPRAQDEGDPALFASKRQAGDQAARDQKQLNAGGLAERLCNRPRSGACGGRGN